MASSATWTAGRRTTLVGLAGLGVGLLLFPETVTTWFWWAVVPLLPVSFLVHPGLWRNVCPLATLGMGPEDAAPRGGPSTRLLSAGAAGVLPLAALVAWRGTGLEQQPLGTGALLAGVVGVAVVAGRRGVRRAGFCNRFCPLLPVERLYGMQPLIEVADDRCPQCSGCTPRGCLDLSTRTAVPQLLGPRRDGAAWVTTPFGAFAAAFPGFIMAYFTATGRAAGVGALLAALLAGAVASWLLAATTVRLTGASWAVAMPTLAALSVGSYYGLSMPRAVAALGGPPQLGRLLAALLVVAAAAWWIRALRIRRGSRAARGGLRQDPFPPSRSAP
jgi:hypothetical protein